MDLGIKSIELRFDDNKLGNLNPVQGDTQSRGYLVEMISTDGEVLKATSDIECRLYGVNSNYPDKTFYTKAEVVDGKYKAYLSTDMLSKAGLLKLQIALYKGTQALIQSEAKEITVLESMANGGAVGKDLVVDFTKLQTALKRVDEQEEAYQKSLADQENIRKEVEKNQQSVLSDKNRVETIKAELEPTLKREAERIKAEALRVQEELKRASAEEKRVSEEDRRKKAEDSRVQEESKRSQAEIKRAEKETKRSQDETKRSKEEVKRVKAEALRVQEESKRASEEAKRLEVQRKTEALLKTLGDNPVGKLGQDLVSLTETVKGKQDKLKAGTGISISLDNTISADKYIKPRSEPISYIDGLRGELDSKAPKEHKHKISDVSNLQTELDGKQDKLTESETITISPDNKISIDKAFMSDLKFMFITSNKKYGHMASVICVIPQSDFDRLSRKNPFTLYLVV